MAERDDDDALLSQALVRLCHRLGRREEKYHYRNCSLGFRST